MAYNYSYDFGLSIEDTKQFNDCVNEAANSVGVLTPDWSDAVKKSLFPKHIKDLVIEKLGDCLVTCPNSHDHNNKYR